MPIEKIQKCIGDRLFRKSLEKVAVYFSILYMRHRAGIVTDEMLTITKWRFAVIGSSRSVGRIIESWPLIDGAKPGITCIIMDKSVENAFSFTIELGWWVLLRKVGKVVGSVWEGRRVVGSGDSGVAGNGGKQGEHVQ
nr:protein CLT2, chloroplastic [Tanacetum cinerariifolium]